MARAGARLTVRQLAEMARVSPNTVTRIEGDQPANTSTVGALRAALETAGVEFLDNGGVRLRTD